jgi:hypothetical protein
MATRLRRKEWSGQSGTDSVHDLTAARAKAPSQKPSLGEAAAYSLSALTQSLSGSSKASR